MMCTGMQVFVSAGGVGARIFESRGAGFGRLVSARMRTWKLGVMMMLRLRYSDPACERGVNCVHDGWRLWVRW